MSASLPRMIAIVRADFLIRFRRTSTVVTLLFLSLLAYLIVPPPSSGRALMVIGGRRALLNSASISLATAMMCSMLLTLIGFYLVGNTLRRDIQARTGFIIAATPMSNFEYLAGKFFGNIVTLGAVASAFMVSTMIMHLIRAEAPLEPLVYCTSFLAIVPTGIVFVSAIALLFESVRFLSGKAGDVLYFFVWSFLIGSSAMLGENGVSADDAALLDIPGLSIMIGKLTAEAHTTQISVGAGTYDQSLPPYEFGGISLSAGWFALRLLSLSVCLPFFAAAVLSFRRFNPEKIKQGAERSSGNLLTMLNGKLKPLVRGLEFLRVGRGHTTLAGAIWVDTLLTFTLSPVTLLAFAVSLVLSITLPHPSLMGGVMPAVFGVLVIVLADVPTRDLSTDMTSLLFTAPLIKERFVWWKFGVALTLTLMFTLVPILQSLAVSPGSGLSLFIGSLLIASAATSLGIMSGSPNAFAVCFLLFLYLVLNGREEPSLDFAGWYGTASPGVQAAYAIVTAGLLGVAELRHRFSLKR